MKARGDVKATWQDWAAAFNRLKPSVLDITGGEPFLNKNLVDILEALDPKIRVGITTNLTQPIHDFVKRISPSKVFSMTLSYHPSQSVITRDAFIGKAMLLAKSGFHVCVNFVAYPEQMYLIPIFKGLFESCGIRFHVDPYGIDNLGPYPYSDAEKTFLAPFIERDRQFRIDKVDPVVRCSGGRDYMLVDPDGYAFRCWALHIAKEPPFGNILDGTFQEMKEDSICSMSGVCGGCDRDKVTISNA
jgi:radical SAM protein with 4Fe4S-binding SPASM domain